MGLIELLSGGKSDEAPLPETPATDSSAAGGDTSAARLASVAAKARKGGRRAAELAEEIRAGQQAAALDELFESENWTEIATLYFDARFAITGDEVFELSDGKKRTLGVTLSKAMKVLWTIDPAYLAVGMFAIHFGGTVAQCEMLHSRKVKEATPE